jgi:hypothetical protein
MIAAIFINAAAVFARSLFGDLLTLAFLLVPLVGLALLYLDIRRKREGFTSEQLRAELDALQSA